MEIAGADFKLAPSVSRRGTEASRKSTTMLKNPCVSRQVSVLTPTRPKYEEGGVRRTPAWPNSFVLHSPPLGERQGHRTHKKGLDNAGKRCGRYPDVIARRSPKQSPNPRDAGLRVSLLEMTGWGRLRSVQTVSCGQRPDQFVETSAVFVVSGEVLLVEGPLVLSGFPCGASGDTDGQAVGWHGAPGGDYCPGRNDSPFFHH
jgi:hypothetical protein